MEEQGLLKRLWPSRTLGLQWVLVLQCTFVNLWIAEAVCMSEKGCGTAYAYYKPQANETLESIGDKFQTTSGEILAANPSIVDKLSIVAHQPLHIPFKCDCIDGQLLHMFSYQVQRTNSISYITTTVYEDLTRQSWIGASNALPDLNFIETGATLKIPVMCFCGDPSVSPDYGLFLTFVVAAGAGGNLSGLASHFSTSEALLRKFNPSVIWDDSQPEQHAFIPVKDENGNYPPYTSGSSNIAAEITTASVLAGVATGVAGALAFLSLVALGHRCYSMEQRRRQQRKQLASKLKNVDVFK